jgi:trans-2-enoyl-CoA reductase
MFKRTALKLLDNYHGSLSRTLTNTAGLHTYNVRELNLREFGKPEDGIELNPYQVSDEAIRLNEDEVFVKLLAAPIEPADFMEIAGKYGTVPQQLPATMGVEGLFEVVKANKSSVNFQPGDWVLPIETNWGSWRSHGIGKESHFYKIPSDLDKEMCSMLKINGVTAYRMLLDFAQLKPNDTIIQNGANGGVGQAVIQLSKLMNLNVVNVVRRRKEHNAQNELIKQMMGLGASYIVHDDELRSSRYITHDLWKEIPRPRLALNCVGGRATSDMVKLLDSKAILVTYGGMARQPLSFNTADFIFKDLKAVGFWVTDWRLKNKKDFEKTIDYLCTLIYNNQLKPPMCEKFKLDDFKKAFKAAQASQTSRKMIFVD